MNEQQQLLDEARAFCEPTTGEVIKRMPEELMKKLRAARLARGVPGKRSQRTETFATWFVFLTSEIRDRVTAEWRKANTARRKKPLTCTEQKRSTNSSSSDTQAGNRGLKQFRQLRKRL